MGLAARIISHTQLPEKAVKAAKEKLKNWNQPRRIPGGSSADIVQENPQVNKKSDTGDLYTRPAINTRNIKEWDQSLHHKGKGFHKEAQACHVEICLNKFTIHYKVVGSKVEAAAKSGWWTQPPESERQG